MSDGETLSPETAPSVQVRNAQAAVERAQIVIAKNYQRLEAVYRRGLDVRELEKEAKRKHKAVRPKTAAAILQNARRVWIMGKREKRCPQRARRYLERNQLPPSNAAFFVVRNVNRNVTKRATYLLKRLGLTRADKGTFIPRSSENLELLLTVSPFVYYGAPSLSLIRQLVTTKAYVRGRLVPDHLRPIDKRAPSAAARKKEEQRKLKVDEEAGRKQPTAPAGAEGDAAAAEEAEGQDAKKAPVLLNSNLLVEELFAKHGLLSIEDVVDQIYRAGPALKDIMDTLCTFRIGSQLKSTGLDRTYIRGEQQDIDAVLRKIL